MKISFSIGEGGGSLTIQREDGDKKAQASGFTREVHGWGAEIHLLGMIQRVLESLGFNLTRTTCSGDGHMYGDDYMQYLRPRMADLRKRGNNFPLIYIVDGSYATRSAAEDYNSGEEVTLQIHGDVFDDFPQPNWWEIVQTICADNNIDCQVSEWLLPPKYEVVEVRRTLVYANQDRDAIWEVRTFGRNGDESKEIEVMKDFNGHTEAGRREAKDEAMLRVQRHLAWNHTTERVELESGGEGQAWIKTTYVPYIDTDGRHRFIDIEEEIMTAGEMRQGDKVDLESCHQLRNHTMAEFEYAEVAYTRNEGDEVIIAYESIGGEYRYSPQQQLRIRRRELVEAEMAGV